MWRGSRHIILVERSRSTHRYYTLWNFIWGWRRELAAQTLLSAGLPSSFAHTRRSYLIAERSRVHIRIARRLAQPALPLHLLVTTTPGYSKPGRPTDTCTA